MKSAVEDRKKRGREILKRYQPLSGTDCYACAVDAITDILLFVAQTQEEGTQLLQSAEMDFRTFTEGETLLTEG